MEQRAPLFILLVNVNASMMQTIADMARRGPVVKPPLIPVRTIGPLDARLGHQRETRPDEPQPAYEQRFPVIPKIQPCLGPVRHTLSPSAEHDPTHESCRAVSTSLYERIVRSCLFTATLVATPVSAYGSRI